MESPDKWSYSKTLDRLYTASRGNGGFVIYSNGKFATRVKEIVKVGQMDYRVSDGVMTLNFHLEKAPKDYPTGLMSFMGQKLEEFLNK